MGAFTDKSAFQVPEELDGVIVGAYFGSDPHYNNGETIQLTIEIDHGADKVFTQRYSVGKNFELTSPDVITITKGKGVNANSNYGKFIDAATEIPEVLKHVENLGGLTATFNAQTWMGLNLHFEKFEEFFKINGVEIEKTSLMPRGYLGVADEGVSANALVELAMTFATVKEFMAAAMKLPVVQASDEIIGDLSKIWEASRVALANQP